MRTIPFQLHFNCCEFHVSTVSTNSHGRSQYYQIPRDHFEVSGNYARLTFYFPKAIEMFIKSIPEVPSVVTSISKFCEQSIYEHHLVVFTFIFVVVSTVTVLDRFLDRFL